MTFLPTRLTILSLFFLVANQLSAQNFNLTFRDQQTYPFSVSSIWGYVDDFGNEYALVGTDAGVSIVDVTDPDNVVEMFAIPHTPSFWREIKTWNKHAYATNESGDGLLIMDLSQLPDTVTYHSYTDQDLKTVHSMWIDENGRAFLWGYNTNAGLGTNERGAMILDLSGDPDNPVFLGTYNGCYFHDGFVRGDTLWGSAIYWGQLLVFDVSDVDSFQLLGLVTTPNSFTHNAWPTSDNNYVFTTDETGNSSLTSYDVSNLSNIIKLDQAKSNPGSNVVVHNVHLVNDDFAAVAYYRDGALIFDVSEPDNMIETGAYDTSPLTGYGFNGDWGIYPYLPSGNWLVSDIENGLFVLSAQYVKAARLQGLVTDTVTGNPINNVNVTITSTNNSDITELDGIYKTGNATGGTYQVNFLVYGYAPKTITVELFNDSIVTQDVQLVPLPGFTITIEAIDESNGNAIADAKYFVTDYGLYQFNGATDSTGLSVLFPVFNSEYEMIIGAWGYKTKLVPFANITSNDTITIELTPGYYDDFYFDFGWTKTQTATSGHWVRGVPIGTYYQSLPVNPGADVIGDFGSRAFVTGNEGGSPTNDDVDDGEVVLISPLFNLADYDDPYLHYTRWFADVHDQNPDPNDSMMILISNGIDTVTIQMLADTSLDYSQWVVEEFRISDFITPSDSMQLFIRVVDVPSSHWTEGAFDLFYITDSLDVPTTTLSVNQLNAHVFPNPANDLVRIQLSKPIAGDYKIVSSSGALIASGKLSKQGIADVSTKKFSSGFYFVEIITSQNRIYSKFIKQ